MGEWSAVRPKTGKSVRQSDPGLRRPKSPATAGRKPAARPPLQTLPDSSIKPKKPARKAAHSQPKTGRGAGWNPAQSDRREAPEIIDEPLQFSQLPDSELAPLVEFFKILDRWDKEAHGSQIV
jgi:hypothetical protein